LHAGQSTSVFDYKARQIRRGQSRATQIAALGKSVHLDENNLTGWDVSEQNLDVRCKTMKRTMSNRSETTVPYRTPLRRQATRRLAMETLEARQLLAITPQLVKDINSSPATAGGWAYELVEAGSIAYFAAATSTTGLELWKTDGTEAGTQQVKDINPGAVDGLPRGYGANPDPKLTAVNDTLFFIATDGVSGLELWKSNGTEAGTVRVKDIWPGPDSGLTGHPDLLNVNGTLYFTAYTTYEENGLRLWKSDGTEAGTVAVKTIEIAGQFGRGGILTNIDGTLYFSVYGPNGAELWKSDGTEAGTVRVSESGPEPGSITYLDGTPYFISGHDNGELWKSDGTEAGTVLVKKLHSPALRNLRNLNGTLYFEAHDGTSEYAVWTSDGTEAGTVLVKDVLGTPRDPNLLIDVNGTLFFTLDDKTIGTELWKSDGTATGTALVKDVRAGKESSYPGELMNVNGLLYFTADDGKNGRELWKSDGTEAGTILVSDLRAGAESSFINGMTNIDGTLYFNQFDAENGQRLWKTDGTETGTVLVADIQTGTGDALPSELTELDGTLFFRAWDRSTGAELWKSDGTEAGTVLVKDIREGPDSGYPRELVNVGGTLFFIANNLKLWKSDGTEQGTIATDVAMQVYEIAQVNGTLYFTGSHGTGSSTLWKTDGTQAGTERVATPGASRPNHLAEAHGMLYFSAEGGTDYELWKSDGTETGTAQVKAWPRVYGRNPHSVTNVNGTVYFTARDKDSGDELWKSDGTNAGTVRVKDIWSGVGDSEPSDLTNINGTLYFTADDGTTGRELWKSDGTEAGTVLVKDIRTGAAPSHPHSLANVNGILYFSASDGVTGEELWTSDGTEAGTVLALDFAPGSGGSDPGGFTVFEGKLFFAATDELNGRELWSAELDPLPGDVDGDGVVQFSDFVILANNFGRTDAGRGDGDLNADGHVDLADFVILANRFGQSRNQSATPSPSAPLPTDVLLRPTAGVELIADKVFERFDDRLADDGFVGFC
jgi:ELWxxDGT repeat protein